MKLITSHETTDFDGLASCVALQKILPGSIIGMSGGLSSNVHQYLSLHRDRFITHRCLDLELDEVDVLAVVDVRKRNRLTHVESVLQRKADDPRSVRVVAWDHHPASRDDIHTDEEHIQPVGAVTTLLVEELRARDVPIDREEATLFSLGVHEDTGSLAYARSCSRDASALAWLMGQGAQSAVLQRYLSPPLGPLERALLVRLLEAVVDVPRYGASIGIAAVEVDDVPSSLAYVVTEAFRLLPQDGLFCVFRLPNGKSHVIGRGQAEAIPIGVILEELGGGGYASAGSAAIRDASMEEVVARLRDGVARHCREPNHVRDLMSSPVRTVEPDTPLQVLASSLREWGHVGAPVVDGGRLVGVISRRDVERAQRQGRAHLAVKSCMAHPVVTVAPDAPLRAALEQMQTRRVGRLPVVENGRVVGIISREDLLAHLYEPSPSSGHPPDGDCHS